MKIGILRILCGLMIFVLISNDTSAQSADELIRQVKEKLMRVKDYKARAVLKTDVSFIRIPQSDVDVYFKRPDKFKIKKEGGISIFPKGGASMNLNSLLANDKFAAVSGGDATLAGSPVKIVKLLPLDETTEVVLTTLYIDKDMLIRKATTTTRDNGTYQMDMEYGRFGSWGLPDKVIFTFNTKSYSLPKGMTLEYEGGAKPPPPDKSTKEQKGRIEVSYSGYVINKGIADDTFKN
ncbi:MAG TPA: hypothetical protein VGD17_18710 [Chitinophagaceae bacterium]